MLVDLVVWFGGRPDTARFVLILSAAAALKEAGQRLMRRVSPRYAVAFRPSTQVVPVPDNTLLGPIAVVLALAVIVKDAGDAACARNIAAAHDEARCQCYRSRHAPRWPVKRSKPRAPLGRSGLVKFRVAWL